MRSARELHRRALVVTSHDHLADYEDLLEMPEGGLDAKVCLVQADVLAWDEEGRDSVLRALYSYEGWARRALRKIERMLRLVEAHPDRFLIVRRVEDVLAAHDSGRSAIVIGLEGTRPLEGEIEPLPSITGWGCAICSSPGRTAARSATGWRPRRAS